MASATTGSSGRSVSEAGRRSERAGLGRLAKDGVMQGRAPGSYRYSDWPILCVPMRRCVQVGVRSVL